MYPETELSYGIIAWGAGSTFEEHVECVLCHQKVNRTAMTSGAQFRNGACALACVRHMQNPRQWLIAWVRFKIAQQAEVSSEYSTGSIGT